MRLARRLLVAASYADRSDGNARRARTTSTSPALRPRWCYSAYIRDRLFRPLQRPCSLVGHRFSGGISPRRSRISRGEAASLLPQAEAEASRRSASLLHTEGVQVSSRWWSAATPPVKSAAKPPPCCRRPKRRRLAGAVSLDLQQPAFNLTQNLLPVAFKPGRRLRPLHLPSARHLDTWAPRHLSSLRAHRNGSPRTPSPRFQQNS
jgi:hypothetical protein